MATRSAHRHAMVVHRPHHSAKPIIIRVKANPPKKHEKHKKHRRGGGAFGEILSSNRTKIFIGSFAVGLLEKSGIAANLPKIPMIGQLGTIGIAAHFLGGRRPGIIQDIATAALTVAAYQLGNTGTITGGEYPDPSPYVQGF
jgi:hypothetical protein